ncbi:MAG TPA: hypothetical protein PK796_09745 [Bacteroidales bacterium]|nr:hypothetical protein [Bacteroidales bacterium]
MPQEDYLLRQFDQLGRALGSLLAGLIGSKGSGQVQDGIDTCIIALKEELDIDLGKLTSVPDSDFMDYLLGIKHFSNGHLGQLADIMMEIAGNRTAGNLKDEFTTKLYYKTLMILNHLEKTETTYSIERHLQIERIATILAE